MVLSAAKSRVFRYDNTPTGPHEGNANDLRTGRPRAQFITDSPRFPSRHPVSPPTSLSPAGQETIRHRSRRQTSSSTWSSSANARHLFCDLTLRLVSSSPNSGSPIPLCADTREVCWTPGSGSARFAWESIAIIRLFAHAGLAGGAGFLVGVWLCRQTVGCIAACGQTCPLIMCSSIDCYIETDWS
ncbi:hypothetical protein IWZ03DRAFT_378811 [Phyllosticta citriasiana]|uniref:Uncharacterized protein n=1 Tax=Phyllosticta citriasiana TaxID=595635 RepID=A0ABR1KP32_9PEZI